MRTELKHLKKAHNDINQPYIYNLKNNQFNIKYHIFKIISYKSQIKYNIKKFLNMDLIYLKI